LSSGCCWPMMRAAYAKLRLLAIVKTEREPAIAQGNGRRDQRGHGAAFNCLALAARMDQRRIHCGVIFAQTATSGLVPAPRGQDADRSKEEARPGDDPTVIAKRILRRGRAQRDFHRPISYPLSLLFKGPPLPDAILR